MTQAYFAGTNRFSALRPTSVFDSYWRFAAERQAVFFRRLGGASEPWTADPIIQRHKFTNAYRASDRVSQFLIRNVIYNEQYSAEIDEVVYRILLFKIFNKIETWRYLESVFGILSWKTFDMERYDKALIEAKSKGQRIYSAAYIMPPVRRDDTIKHRGHLWLLREMMKDDLPKKLDHTRSLSAVFWLLKSYPSLGDFIAFQLAIDLNYSEVINYSESDFVVAGPGARDGLSKCFENSAEFTPEDLIELVMDHQEDEFKRVGLEFKSLWGRRLQLVDCQNLFCEISKYARVAHPEFLGVAGRTRIKQIFHPTTDTPLPWYPPKWGLNAQLPETLPNNTLL